MVHDGRGDSDTRSPDINCFRSARTRCGQLEAGRVQRFKMRRGPWALRNRKSGRAFACLAGREAPFWGRHLPPLPMPRVPILADESYLRYISNAIFSCECNSRGCSCDDFLIFSRLGSQYWTLARSQGTAQRSSILSSTRGHTHASVLEVGDAVSTPRP